MRKKAEFDFVFDAPERRSSDGFFLVLGRSCFQSGGRLGLIVSKRAVGNAVARNRIKRLVRESFRHEHLADYDLVVIARNACRDAEGDKIFASLNKHWQRFRS